MHKTVLRTQLLYNDSYFAIPLLMFKALFVGLLLVCSGSSYAEIILSETIRPSLKSFVNPKIERMAIPPTPNNMILPAFGQGVIGWGSGPQDAHTRLLNLKHADVEIIKAQGVTLEMAKAWQDFYENETQRNPGNPTAPFRAQLMQKIVQLW